MNKKIIHSLIFSFLFLTIYLTAENSSYLEDIRQNKLNQHLSYQLKKNHEKKKNQTKISFNEKFYVLTIPKAGTFHLAKMLKMLTSFQAAPIWSIHHEHIWKFANEDSNALISESILEKYFEEANKKSFFLLAHFNFSENFLNYSLNHSNYVKIILIRDLRDVCVSTVYYLSEEIENVINSSSFDDKLMFIINQGALLLNDNGCFWKIEKHAKIAAQWMRDPEAVLCRFEDLVGPDGGGSLEAQENQIKLIANSLGIFLSKKKLKKITDNLFGVRNGPDVCDTFRRGKIGSWQDHFNEEHKEVFNRILGPVQEELGYPIF